MSLFAIADLHLSLGADKPMDVFPGWQDYVERLEKNWRAIVKDSDTVVLAGDISWAMKLEDTGKDFAFIQSLPGRKLLLKGNHDYWWSTRKKMDTYLENSGFDTLSVVHNSAVPVGSIAVCGTRGWFYDARTEEDEKIVNREVGRLNASIDQAEALGLEPVVFLHYPPVFSDYECREIMDVLISRKVKRCYYGHIHGGQAAKKAVTGEYRGIKLYLVSCDYTGFVPYFVE